MPESQANPEVELETLVAIAFAVGTAICFYTGIYLNKKAVADLPKVGLKREEKGIVKAFVKSRTMQKAVVASVFGAGLYIVAISLAPVSVVQPIVASGVVLLAYLAIKNLGETPRRADYFAISLNITGVILIGISLSEGIPKDIEHNPEVFWICVAAVVSLALLVQVFMRGRTGTRQAAGLGISVGLLYGIGAVFARLMIVDWGNQWSSKGFLALFSSVYLIGWLVTFVPAFIMVQAAYQKGMAVVVVPIFAGLAQLVPIVVGTVALNEPLPDNPALIAARIAAFVLILSGTVILSRRAEEAAPGMQPGEEPALAIDEAPA